MRACLAALAGPISARWQLIFARDFFIVVDRFLFFSLGPLFWLLTISANDNPYFNAELARWLVHLPMVVHSSGMTIYFAKWLRRNRRNIDHEDRVALFLTWLLTATWAIFWLLIAFSNQSPVICFVPFWIYPFLPYAFFAICSPCFLAYSLHKLLTSDDFDDDDWGALVGVTTLFVIFTDIFLAALFIVLKAQGYITWPWRLVLVPAWLIDVFVAVSLGITTATFLYRPGEAAVSFGEVVAALLCFWFVFIPLVVVQARICLMEQNTTGDYTIFDVIFPMLVGWAALLLLKIGHRLLEALRRCVSCYR
jgi:hypothetical protein